MGAERDVNLENAPPKSLPRHDSTASRLLHEKGVTP